MSASAVQNTDSVKPYITSGERFAAAMDYIEAAAGLRGWALDLQHPSQPVAIEARCLGRVLARTEAMMDRPDLDAVVGRPTYCGFLMGWSRFDRILLEALATEKPTAEITLHLTLTGALVPNVVGPLEVGALAQLVRANPQGDLVSPFAEVNAYLEIRASGLFDEEWYAARYGSKVPEGMPPLLYYLRHGEAEATRPNLLFDPKRYAELAELPESSGALLDFLRMGSLHGIAPSPHFEEQWYRRQHPGLRGAQALAHYLAHRTQFAPNAWFDRIRYAAASGQPADSDLYTHFVLIGSRTEFARFAAKGGRIPKAVLADIEALHALDSLPPISVMAVAAPRSAPQSSFDTGEETGEGSKLPSLAALGRVEVTKLITWARGLSEAEREIIRNRAAAAVTAGQDEALAPMLLLYLCGGHKGGPLADVALVPALLERARVLSQEQRIKLFDLLLTETHHAFESGSRGAALVAYAALQAAGVQDQIVYVRLLEHALTEGDTARARLFAEELQHRYTDQLTPWAVFALSRLYQAVGETARAVAMLHALPRYPAISATAESIVIFRLIECEAIDLAEERLEETEGLPKEEALAPRFRLAVYREDTVAIQELIAAGKVDKLPDWLLCEAIFRLTAEGRVSTRAGGRVLRGLYRILERRGLTSNNVVQARLHYLLMTRQFDAMGALLAEVEQTPIGGLRETQLRRLEYYGNIGNIEAADALYRQAFQSRPLNKWEGLVVLRLLSDRKEWGEAGEILLAHITQGYDFATNLHMAMRVVRRARLHERVLALEAALGENVKEGLKTFFALVQEDLLLREGLREGVNTAIRRCRSYRSDWLIHSPLAESSSRDYCLFQCSNERYFLSLLTFLCSFMSQAPQVNAQHFVFLDRDVPRSWILALRIVGEHFRRDITVVEETDFVPTDVDLKDAYGFFAGGSRLARAAYFRIYAARYLLDNFHFRRGAYIDTDIICRGDLTPLFEMDMGDALLLAKREDVTPHVVNAAVQHGLDPWRYFNSGVLLLRFDDSRLRKHIEEAIRISEEEADRLHFQDQCALNIAFNGVVGDLPSRFNHFLRPHRDRNGYIEDGLLLHFLDRPKPWDISFDRPYREEWRVWAVLLGLLLPRNLYIAIFAAANQE